MIVLEEVLGNQRKMKEVVAAEILRSKICIYMSNMPTVPAYLELKFSADNIRQRRRDQSIFKETFIHA